MRRCNAVEVLDCARAAHRSPSPKRQTLRDATMRSKGALPALQDVSQTGTWLAAKDALSQSAKAFDVRYLGTTLWPAIDSEQKESGFLPPWQAA